MLVYIGGPEPRSLLSEARVSTGAVGCVQKSMCVFVLLGVEINVRICAVGVWFRNKSVKQMTVHGSEKTVRSRDRERVSFCLVSVVE